MSLTIAEMNSLLSKAGINVQLTPDLATQLLSHQPKQRIINATVRAAENDLNAKGWLQNLFNQVGAIGQGQANSSGQAADRSGSQHGAQKQSLPAAASSPEQQAPQPLPTNPPQNGQVTREYHSVHVYGSRGALCFEADETRAGEPTVAIDAARSSGTRQYDWSNKLRIQLTTAELPVVALVLLGKMMACEFKNHGPQSDKGFSLECQQDKVFIKVFGGNNQGVVAVPVSAIDVFKVTTLIMRQLHAQAPYLQGSDLTVMLHSMSRRMGGC